MLEFLTWRARGICGGGGLINAKILLFVKKVMLSYLYALTLHYFIAGTFVSEKYKFIYNYC
jgi:hypothetical protein